MAKKFLCLFAVFMLIVAIYGCGANNENEGSNVVSESTVEEENITTETSKALDDENDLETSDIDDEIELIDPENGVRDETLKGRGSSDVGRSEPEYVGIIGYIGVMKGYPMDGEIENWTWTVSTYEQDKQFWKESSNVDHKTEVLVKEQILEHEGYGNYTGYLLVERTDTKEQIYIDVKDFITNPYWLNEDVEEAVRIGDFVAEFKQLSDYYPVNKSGEKIELKDGTFVLAIGTTGTYGSGGPDNNTNQIEVVVLSDNANNSRIFINKEDLSIIY